MPDESQPQGGLAVFLLFMMSILVYSAGLWLIVKMLNDVDVISWRLPWRTCTSINAIFIILRNWDRVVFARKR
jgi:hypothetical protein